MPRVFVAPGHGVRPDGVFDLGAVAGPGGRYQEHRLNTLVANALAVALRRCGFEVLLEQGGGDHDPTFTGSVQAANAWGADYAVEVHHNADGGTGVEVLVNDHTSHANRQLAELLALRMATALGLPNRGVIARSREYFNRTVACPSCMPECAFVDSPADQHAIDRPGYATTVAEAICQAICAFFRVPYRSPGAAATEQELTVADVHEVKAMLAEVRAEQAALRRDLTVKGTTGLEQTIEDMAGRERQAVQQGTQLLGRLGEVEETLAQVLAKLAAQPVDGQVLDAVPLTYRGVVQWQGSVTLEPEVKPEEG